ncbi:hypothetical protein ABIC45_001569 [Mucilaginibacter rubeus]|uniref:WYL domain-containing protein n=1 Tax=Mucilaginibacter rubeus TaxID=2027860 RepID=UPI003393F431
MAEDLFHVGDIVALTSHPYHYSLTNIKVSGEPLQVSPLMVITEVFFGKIKKDGPSVQSCKCLWFSTKLQNFEHAWIKFADLKIIEPARSIVHPIFVEPGQLFTLRSMDIELGKLKSSLQFNDAKASIPTGDTVLTALLPFLCPVLHASQVARHISNLPVYEKGTRKVIRAVHSWDVKCFWYNPLGDKLSQATLPIEALKLVKLANEGYLEAMDTVIELGQVITTILEKQYTVIKPKHLAYRSGYYFLRAFDYLRNENIEINIDENFDYNTYSVHFIRKAPIFDVRTKPVTGVKEIKKEVTRCIKLALRDKHQIRIKYKNRHGELSIRTLKDFEVIKSPKTKLSKYVIGYCCLRNEERTFKISRIQQIEELIV